MAVLCALALPIGWNICHAQQQTIPPTDTDLKAAYCVTVEQNLLTKLRQIWGYDLDSPGPDVDPSIADLNRKTWDDEAEKLKHLQRYLLPRIRFIDAGGLLAANAQAEWDFSRADDKEISACTARCTSSRQYKPEQDVAGLTACIKACDPDTFPRLSSCNDLSWLPF